METNGQYHYVYIKVAIEKIYRAKAIASATYFSMPYVTAHLVIILVDKDRIAVLISK
jgi:hypothetical protein